MANTAMAEATIEARGGESQVRRRTQKKPMLRALLPGVTATLTAMLMLFGGLDVTGLTTGLTKGAYGQASASSSEQFFLALNRVGGTLYELQSCRGNSETVEGYCVPTWKSDEGRPLRVRLLHVDADSTPQRISLAEYSTILQVTESWSNYHYTVAKNVGQVGIGFLAGGGALKAYTKHRRILELDSELMNLERHWQRDYHDVQKAAQHHARTQLSNELPSPLSPFGDSLPTSKELSAAARDLYGDRTAVLGQTPQTYAEIIELADLVDEPLQHLNAQFGPDELRRLSASLGGGFSEEVLEYLTARAHVLSFEFTRYFSSHAKADLFKVWHSPAVLSPDEIEDLKKLVTEFVESSGSVEKIFNRGFFDTFKKYVAVETYFNPRYNRLSSSVTSAVLDHPQKVFELSYEFATSGGDFSRLGAVLHLQRIKPAVLDVLEHLAQQQSVYLKNLRQSSQLLSESYENFLSQSLSNRNAHLGALKSQRAAALSSRHKAAAATVALGVALSVWLGVSSVTSESVSATNSEDNDSSGAESRGKVSPRGEQYRLASFPAAATEVYSSATELEAALRMLLLSFNPKEKLIKGGWFKAEAEYCVPPPSSNAQARGETSESEVVVTAWCSPFFYPNITLSMPPEYSLSAAWTIWLGETVVPS